MTGKKKILWPIDPTGSEEKTDASLRSFLMALGTSVEIEIQPIHVVSADYFITSEYFEPIDTSALKENMKTACADYLKKFEGLNLNSALVLDNSYSARGAETRLFLDYCKSYQPDFVILSSHGRQGWSRAFMGSFTENFVLNSEWPVIVIGPNCEKRTEVKSAIMPVELSESSQAFVEKFLDDHRLSFIENLQLFHKISMVDLEDITWAPTLYGLGDFASDDILKKARETTSNFLQSFMDHPLGQKRVTFGISEKLEPVADVVNQEAKNADCDLVVMRSEAGTLAANLLGSVTRDIVRSSPVPVIIYPHLYQK